MSDDTTPPTTFPDSTGVIVESAHVAKVRDRIKLGGSPEDGMAAWKVLGALENERKDLKFVLREKRRVARLIDVAIHGEEGAAESPALVDVLASVEKLVAERDVMAKTLDITSKMPSSITKPDADEEFRSIEWRDPDRDTLVCLSFESGGVNLTVFENGKTAFIHTWKDPRVVDLEQDRDHAYKIANLAINELRQRNHVGDADRLHQALYSDPAS